MSAHAVARAVGGVVRGDGDVIVSGAEVDSRLIRNGDLFIALPGARVDGHTFVPTALEQASAALVRNDVDLPPPPADRALIAVPDPLAAGEGPRAAGRRAPLTGYHPYSTQHATSADSPIIPAQRHDHRLPHRVIDPVRPLAASLRFACRGNSYRRSRSELI